MTRLAVILSHPTQYYSPWFRWLAAHTELQLRVFYLWDFGVTDRRDPKFQRTVKWDVDLLSGYESEFVPNAARAPATDRFGGLWNPSLPSRLRRFGPDAVLFFGYQSRSHLLALAWARLQGIPALFRGDSHFLGRGRPGGARRVVLATLYRQFQAFLPVGRANLDYFRLLGVPAARCHFAPHSVNAAHFDPAATGVREAAAALRHSLGIPAHHHVVLFAGKLVALKQPVELLDAFLAARAPDSTLLLVGDGPLRPEVERRAAGRGDVRLLPFANQSEMPVRYAMAQLFVLPSRGHYETWGLAVNEAMHMGVPALVSDLVGCQQDLVTDGDTGWVWQTTGAEGLAGALARALHDLRAPTGTGFGARARQRAARYTYVQTTAGLKQALDDTLRR